MLGERACEGGFPGAAEDCTLTNGTELACLLLKVLKLSPWYLHVLIGRSCLKVVQSKLLV